MMEESYALTEKEITRLEGLFDRHMAGYAMACDLVDFKRRRRELSSLVYSYLLSIGFVRLREEDIKRGAEAVALANQNGPSGLSPFTLFVRAATQTKKETE